MMNENLNVLSAKTNTHVSGEAGIALDNLIEQVWQGLNRQVQRERVHELVLEEASPFQDAIVAQIVPYLIHRRVRVRLIDETKTK